MPWLKKKRPNLLFFLLNNLCLIFSSFTCREKTAVDTRSWLKRQSVWSRCLLPFVLWRRRGLSTRSPQTPSLCSERYYTLGLNNRDVALSLFTGESHAHVCHMIKADNHQENLVIAEAKKLEPDGIINFVNVNEVRYVTEYNQMVGFYPPSVSVLHVVNVSGVLMSDVLFVFNCTRTRDVQ